MAINKRARKMTSTIHTTYTLIVGGKLVKQTEKKMLIDADRGNVRINSMKKILAYGSTKC